MSATNDLLRSVHLVGIGGDGMAGIAAYLADMGGAVSGSDARWSASLDRLRTFGVTVHQGHDAENLGRATLVVASDAIDDSNVELAEARLRDLPILRRAECLDSLSRSKRPIFVAGSHGKSTTTGMIATVLQAAGAEPSFILGADVPALNSRRAGYAPGEYFVGEACEAFQNLTPLHPFFAVVTNIDDDHLEHYGSQAKIDRAFRDFVERTDPLGAVLVNGDDDGIRRALAGCDRTLSTFGFSSANDVVAQSVMLGAAGSRFDVAVAGRRAGTIHLSIPGRHAASNALACVAVCLKLGLRFEHISDGLAQFTGVARRWHDYGLVGGVRLVDDYAHHPTELRASIETARLVATNGQRLVVAFQPQLFSRTQRLFREFAQVLATCDHVLLVDVDPGGERNRTAAQHSLIGDELRKRGGSADLVEDIDHLVERCDETVREGDFLLVAGAGSIRTAASRVRERLQARSDGPLAGIAGPAFPAHLRGWTQWPKSAPAIASGSPSVLTMFRSCVAVGPNRCAASDHRRNVSYLDLGIASDAFAAVLETYGVTPGSVVGVSAPSSIELLVVVLATAKLGAAYLPLDAGLPVERVRFMLAQARADVLVAPTGSYAADAFAGVRNVALEEAGSVLDARLRRTASDSQVRRDPQAIASESVAYICFTSGSAGKPKGVAVTHASLHALIDDIVRRLEIGANTRTALNTSIGFDVSLAEMWMTLAGGGQLLVTGASKPLVGARLGAFLEAHDVSHLAVTPTVLGSMPHRALPALSWIVCAGEACPRNLVDLWAPGRRFINAYGPTEATIYATMAECRSGEPITIGKPLPNVRTYVLNGDLEPVPAGEPGELCLAGPSVARGYLGVENTAFCDLLQCGEFVDRIYRTGDLVTLEHDGNLRYHGRIDDQVKINGNRIEIEEIEHTACTLRGIAKCVVGTSAAGGAAELICFVVQESPGAISANAIREHLSRWLPSYMVPDHYVDVDAIPMTPSGKKDRRLLVETQKPRSIRRPFFSAARTSVEAELVAIWKDVLHVNDEIGVYDDFASLGGDSLGTLLLIDKIELHFCVSVPPGYFPRFTTIEALALQIEELVWRRAPAAGQTEGGFLASRIYHQQRHLIASWEGERVDENGLIRSVGTHAPRFDVFVCVQYEDEVKMLAKHLGDDVRVHGMRSGHLIMPYTDDNVDALSAQYVHEMAAIRPTGQVVLCGICQGGTIARAMADTLGRQNGAYPFLALVEQARLSEYRGRVAFFYLEESYLNPYRRFETGLARYDQIYADRYSVDIIPGPHGSFQEPSAQHFAAKLRARLDEHFGPASLTPVLHSRAGRCSLMRVGGATL